MLDIETVYSPCYGTIEKVLIEKTNNIYEWEKLFLIKKDNGKMTEVTIGISGYITSLEVQQGDKVTPHTVLARVKDDLLITGSD